MTARPNPPLMSPAQAANLLDHVIFARVAELIDLPRLYDLEAVLAYQIGSIGADPERGAELARAMIDRALLRLARTPRRLHPRAPFVRDHAAAASPGGRAAPAAGGRASSSASTGSGAGAAHAAADRASQPRGPHRAAHVIGRHSAGLPDPDASPRTDGRDPPTARGGGGSGGSGAGGGGSGGGGDGSGGAASSDENSDGDGDESDDGGDGGGDDGGDHGGDDGDDACDLCGGPLDPRHPPPAS